MTQSLRARRALLYAAVLGGAGVSGWAWRRWHAPESEQPDPQLSLWQQQFLQPDGRTLAMADFRGHPLVLNFWATWCPPCVEELPLLDRFYDQNIAKGWQVLGLAVDESEPVKRFLARSPVKFPVAMAGFSGVALSRSLGNLAGGLPFTLVFDAAGQVIHRKIGAVTEDDLAGWRQGLR